MNDAAPLPTMPRRHRVGEHTARLQELRGDANGSDLDVIGWGAGRRPPSIRPPHSSADRQRTGWVIAVRKANAMSR